MGTGLPVQDGGIPDEQDVIDGELERLVTHHALLWSEEASEGLPYSHSEYKRSTTGGASPKGCYLKKTEHRGDLDHPRRVFVV